MSEAEKKTDAAKWPECPCGSPVAKKLWHIFENMDAKARLAVWCLWELQSAEGSTRLDLANPIMQQIDGADAADDPELSWLKGICEGMYLLNSHS